MKLPVALSKAPILIIVHIPVTVVVKLVIAGHSDETTPGRAEGVEDLYSRITPHLTYTRTCTRTKEMRSCMLLLVDRIIFWDFCIVGYVVDRARVDTYTRYSARGASRAAYIK